jgi:heparan-alpha-glucosaminide N-acetyltransferase
LYYPSKREVTVADARPARIQSIDLLRGADVLLMLFVNEVAGVAGAPEFLKHKGAADDGMTITDLVFPAFLFVVGMAIPFALGSRLARGESRLAALRHVLGRSAALVVIGVLMVNAEHGVAGWLSMPVWNVLMTLGVLLVWGLPRGGGWERHRVALRALGAAVLIFVALAYRGQDITGWMQLRPYWWGILGLIGWAYLGVASLFLVTGARPAILTALVALYGCVALADKAGGFGWPAIPGPLVGGVVGTHGAVVLAGSLLGVLVQRHLRTPGSPWRFAAEALGIAAAFGAAALLLHALHGLHLAFTISKIHATLPWGLLSAALTTAAWTAIFLIADVLGHREWPKAVRIAGENPLLAYLLAPFLLSLFELAAPLFGGTNPYEAISQPVVLGLVRSAVFAWAVVRLTGWLRERGLRFQL